jgi:hypothetical protein
VQGFRPTLGHCQRCDIRSTLKDEKNTISEQSKSQQDILENIQNKNIQNKLGEEGNFYIFLTFKPKAGENAIDGAANARQIEEKDRNFILTITTTTTVRESLRHVVSL